MDAIPAAEFGANLGPRRMARSGVGSLVSIVAWRTVDTGGARRELTLLEGVASCVGAKPKGKRSCGPADGGCAAGGAGGAAPVDASPGMVVPGGGSVGAHCAQPGGRGGHNRERQEPVQRA